jgi:hypothetical protein
MAAVWAAVGLGFSAGSSAVVSLLEVELFELELLDVEADFLNLSLRLQAATRSTMIAIPVSCFIGSPIFF